MRPAIGQFRATLQHRTALQARGQWRNAVYVTLVVAMTSALAVLMIGMPSGAAHAAPPTSISVGNTPEDIAVTPDGSRLFVANLNDVTASVVDTATGTVVGTIPVPSASSVQVSPDGTLVYFASLGANAVYVFNAITLAAVGTPIAVGAGPISMAILPSGNRLFVANGTSNDVSVIDTASGSVVNTIPLPGLPYGVAVSPDGSRVYVSERSNDAVAVIDTATNLVVTTISVGVNPWHLDVSPNGTTLYVANQGSNSVSIIDLPAGTVSHTVPFNGPTSVVVSKDSASAFVTGAGDIAMIDRASYSVLSTVPVAGAVDAVLSPDGTSLYAVNPTANTLTFVNVAGIPRVSAPTSVSVMLGTSAVFPGVLSSAGAPVPVNWQVSSDAGATWTDIPGATSVSYSFVPVLADSGSLYRLRAVSADYGTSVSVPTTLTVTAATVRQPPAQGPANEELAATGVDPAPGVIIGIALLTAGLLALFFRRRQARRQR